MPAQVAPVTGEQFSVSQKRREEPTSILGKISGGLKTLVAVPYNVGRTSLDTVFSKSVSNIERLEESDLEEDTQNQDINPPSIKSLIEEIPREFSLETLAGRPEHEIETLSIQKGIDKIVERYFSLERLESDRFEVERFFYELTNHFSSTDPVLSELQKSLANHIEDGCKKLASLSDPDPLLNVFMLMNGLSNRRPQFCELFDKYQSLSEVFWKAFQNKALKDEWVSPAQLSWFSFVFSSLSVLAFSISGTFSEEEYKPKLALDFTGTFFYVGAMGASIHNQAVASRVVLAFTQANLLRPTGHMRFLRHSTAEEGVVLDRKSELLGLFDKHIGGNHEGMVEIKAFFTSLDEDSLRRRYYSVLMEETLALFDSKAYLKEKQFLPLKGVLKFLRVDADGSLELNDVKYLEKQYALMIKATHSWEKVSVKPCVNLGMLSKLNLFIGVVIFIAQLIKVANSAMLAKEDFDQWASEKNNFTKWEQYSVLKKEMNESIYPDTDIVDYGLATLVFLGALLNNFIDSRRDEFFKGKFDLDFSSGQVEP